MDQGHWGIEHSCDLPRLSCFPASIRVFPLQVVLPFVPMFHVLSWGTPFALMMGGTWAQDWSGSGKTGQLGVGARQTGTEPESQPNPARQRLRQRL